MALRFDVASVNITDRQTFEGADPAILAGKMGLTANPIKPQELSIGQPALTQSPGGMS